MMVIVLGMRGLLAGDTLSWVPQYITATTLFEPGGNIENSDDLDRLVQNREYGLSVKAIDSEIPWTHFHSRR